MNNSERVKYWNDKKLIAIDPGKNGGIAIFSVDKEEVIEVIKMPDTHQDLLNYLSLYSNNSICYLEKVGGLPGILSIQPQHMIMFAFCMLIAIVIPFVLTVIVCVPPYFGKFSVFIETLRVVLVVEGELSRCSQISILFLA